MYARKRLRGNVLLPFCVDGNELIERMSKLKIKAIPIEDDIQLDWNVGFCSNDYAFKNLPNLLQLLPSQAKQLVFTEPAEPYIIRLIEKNFKKTKIQVVKTIPPNSEKLGVYFAQRYIRKLAAKTICAPRGE